MTPPTTKQHRVTNVKQPITLHGTATDAGRVRRVRVSVARHIGKLCRFLLADGKSSTARSCDKTSYLDAKGTSSWEPGAPVLPYGRYTIWTRGIDADGNVERKNHAQNLLVVRIPTDGSHVPGRIGTHVQVRVPAMPGRATTPAAPPRLRDGERPRVRSTSSTLRSPSFSNWA